MAKIVHDASAQCIGTRATCWHCRSVWIVEEGDEIGFDSVGNTYEGLSARWWVVRCPVCRRNARIDWSDTRQLGAHIEVDAALIDSQTEATTEALASMANIVRGNNGR